MNPIFFRVSSLFAGLRTWFSRAGRSASSPDNPNITSPGVREMPVVGDGHAAISERKVSIGWGIIRRHWVTVLGLVAACVAFGATQQYAERQVEIERQRMLPAGGVAEVLVAARDLRAGELMTPLTVAVRSVPREWIPHDSLGPGDFDTIAQRPLMSSLRSGVPVTTAHLRTVKVDPTVLQVDPGHRAISIAVDEVSSISGLIRPGDRIDLWGSPVPPLNSEPGGPVSITADRASAHRSARLVAENLRVVATGGRTQRDDLRLDEKSGHPDTAPQAYSSLTLSVPPTIASAVLGGQFQGRFAVALRSAIPERAGLARRSAQRPPLRTIQDLLPVEILMGGLEGALQ
jgi:pilus assembly protein CpaB